MSNHRCRPSEGAVAALLFLLCLGLWAVPAQAEAGAPPATVQAVSGPATLRRSGLARLLALAVRRTLAVGDVVSTGRGGKATILFSDGSQARLNANASIQITAPQPLGRGRRSLFRALAGQVWSQLRPGRAVQTRSATLAVRGTEVHLEVAGDGTTVLTVVEGEVEFFNPFGEVVVARSQQSVARVGQAPSRPVTVANPGLIVEWTLDLDRALIPREKYFVSPDRRFLEAEAPARERRVREHPADAKARLALGDVLFDLRRFEAARVQYAAALASAAPSGAASLRLGHALLELGDLEAALKYLEASRREETAAATGLASLELARDRPAAAQRWAEEALAADATSAEARLHLGLALMRQQGRLGDAAAAFEEAARAAHAQVAGEGVPSHLESQARAWLGLVLSSQGDVRAALEEARAAVRLAPQSALARGNLALVLLFASSESTARAEAQREAEAASRLAPGSASALVVLAQALLARGDVDAASEAAARAVALDPSLAPARYLLGVADASRRDLRHAIPQLRESLRLAPSFLPAASALARVLTLAGRKAEAVAVLESLLPQHREAGEVLAALGTVLYEQGRYAEATRQLARAAELKPDSALVQADLARARLYDNQLAPSIEAARRAVELAPGVAAYHSTLGLAYHFSGLGAQSERAFRTALALNPQDALARVRLGLNAGPNVGVTSVTQGFLFDPAISNQLMRGGIDAEVSPAAGDRRGRSLAAAHRAVGGEGAFHAYGLLNRNRDPGEPGRANSGSGQATAAEYATYSLGRRTTLLGSVARFRSARGLPGPASRPLGSDLDDRASFGGEIAQVAARHRLAPGKYLWAGLLYEPLRGEVADPDLQTSPLARAFGLPVRRQASRSEAIVPEARFDWEINRAPERRTTLTLGVAHARLSPRSSFDLVPTNVPIVVPLELASRERLTAGYVQIARRWDDRFSLVAQMRRQSRRGDTSVLFGGRPRPRQSIDETLGLPSLLLSYAVDKRTSLRFFANRRRGEVASLALAPTEAVLTTEATTQPNGTPLTSRTLELDVERSLGRGSFLKAFVFRTTARDLRFGSQAASFAYQIVRPLQLGRVWHSGLGLRYEQQLAPHLFGRASVQFSRTNNRTPGAAFSAQDAPYQPRRQAALSLDYIGPTGTKVRLGADHIGSFFQDIGPRPAGGARPRFPSHTYFSLGLAKETSVRNEVFVNVFNVFDRPLIAFNDFPTGGRRIQAGVTRRF